MSASTDHNRVRRQSRPLIGVLLKRYPKLSETFVLGELLGLEQAGFRLHIFSLYPPSDQRSHPQCSQLQARVDYLPGNRLQSLHNYLPAHFYLCLRKPLRYLSSLLRQVMLHDRLALQHFLMAGWLARRMLMEGIEHCHTHFINEPGSVALLASRLSGIPYSLSAHAKDIYLSRRAELAIKLGAARFTVTCTEYNRHYLQSLAPENAVVRRMYHGIDFSRLSAHQATAGLSEPETPRLLSIGRLREKKGLPVLIEACRSLQRQGTAFRCDIVGYGPDRNRLKALIHGAGLDGIVRLRGKLDHDEVIQLFRIARVFVLPCIISADGDRDGIPNVILEALAMKVPVVSTRVSGIPEIIRHNQTGLLVEQNDPAALSVALLQLLNNPGLCQRLSDAGYQSVRKQFSNEANLKQLKQLLLQATSRTAPWKLDHGHEVTTT